MATDLLVVAEVYVEAFEAGRATPVSDVAETFGESEVWAAYAVRAARKAGLLVSAGLLPSGPGAWPPRVPKPSDLRTVVRAKALCRSGEARHLRETRGFSLQDVATELRVSAAAVSRWERALVLPSGDNAIRYARVLDRLRRLPAIRSATDAEPDR